MFVGQSHATATGGEVIHRGVGQPSAEHGPSRGSALARMGGE
jgi:hypothetical protein